LSNKKNVRTCAICKKKFELVPDSRNRLRERKTCSKTCSNKIYRSKWSDEEINVLLELAQTLPSESLFRTYNIIASSRNFKKRTSNALRMRLQRLGISLTPCVEWYPISQIAEMLGLCYKTVSNWEKYGLKVSRMSNCRRSPRFVHQSELKKFIKSKPRFFGGCNRFGIYSFLEDIDAVDNLLKKYPTRHHPTRRYPVEKIDTGEIFESITAAAKAVGASPKLLCRAISEGIRCRGTYWRIISK
jgi:hypothetical protein